MPVLMSIPLDFSSSTASARSRMGFARLAAGIALLSTLLHVGALAGGMVSDDHDLLTVPEKRGCGTNPLECFRHPVFGLYYRPVMTATFALGDRLHRSSVLISHLENLLLHAAVVALVLWFFRLLFRRDLPALLAGLLFGLHPLNVGATAFIGGRTDSLALFFLAWFGIGLLQARDCMERGNRLAWQAVSLAGFAAAVFTKEQCIPLALLAPLLWAGAEPEARRPSRPARWLWLYAAPVLAYLLAARQILPLERFSPVDWSLAQRIEMTGRTLWYYAKAFCFPTLRALHQSTLGPWEPPQPLVMLLGYSVAGLWIAGMASFWPNRTRRCLALWTTLTLLPCLNLFPAPSQPVASYRAYLPLLGLAGLTGLAFANAFARVRKSLAGPIKDPPPPVIKTGSGWPAASRPHGRNKELRLRNAFSYTLLERRALAAGGLLAGLGLTFAILTVMDVAVWRNDIALARAQIAADPNFWPAQVGLGNMLVRQGRAGEALAAYDAAMERLLPGAQTWEERARLARAPETRRRLASMSGPAWNLEEVVSVLARGRGSAYQQRGEYERAIADYRLALAFAPEDALTREALAGCLLALGRSREAEEELRALLMQAPNARLFALYGDALARQGLWTQARDAFAQALALPNVVGLNRALTEQYHAEAARRASGPSRR